MAKTKLKMDAETRKKLIGYSVVSDSLKFTPEIPGVDPEYLPTFLIKALSAEDQRKIKFMFMESTETKKFSTQEKLKKDEYLQELTRKSIVGFDNLLDLSTDELVDWKPSANGVGIDIDLFNSMPTMLKVHVMNEILHMNGLA